MKSKAALKQERHRIRYAREGSVYVSTVGTIRRVRALHTLGWTTTDIARRCDRSKHWLKNIMGRQRMHRTNAEKIKAVYDELWDQRAPVSSTGSRMRNRALANGWLPPMAWDDDLIEDPSYIPRWRSRTG